MDAHRHRQQLEHMAIPLAQAVHTLTGTYASCTSERKTLCHKKCCRLVPYSPFALKRHHPIEPVLLLPSLD